MKIKEYIKTLIEETHELDKYNFPEDILRIKKVMENKGIELTIQEANELWSTYSDKFCACWLCLPSNDEELAKIIIDTAKEIYSGAEL